MNRMIFKIKLILFMACVCLFSLKANAQKTDWLIVPGVRVGAITKRTAERDLIRIYGKKNVKRAQVHIGEGEMVNGTVLYPNDALREISIVWKDSKNYRNPDYVKFGGEKSVWKTANGVSLGTTLAQLEKLNGKPFILYGFSWDYGGTISSWENGRLARDFKNKVTLRMDYHSTAALTDEEDSEITGDQEISSSNKTMRKIKPSVHEFIVSF